MAPANVHGQPIGVAVPGWGACPWPPGTPMIGRYCRVERADPGRHAGELFAAFADAPDDRAWTYLLDERPAGRDAYVAWFADAAGRADPCFQVIVEAAGGRAVGVAAYLRIDASNGVFEVGHINFSQRLQRTRAATEAMFLMMRRAFDELGYRRYEWKCDALNAPSRRAALRLGFSFEGVFRQALVTKGRNRDTAWFSIIDTEWPALRARFQAWLEPANFAGDVQRAALADVLHR